MRLELFVKDRASLCTSARQLINFGACGLNIPHKDKQSDPLEAVRALGTVLPPQVMREVVPHYSLKFGFGGSPAKTLAQFETFCEGMTQLESPPRQVLLVSGAGSRKFDSVELLRAMTLPRSAAPEIGVAFNPFFPERAARERERARMRLKLGTGRVSAVWLQIGSDVDLLRDALGFLESLATERSSSFRIYGSIFIPSRQLLARMKFRPWNGVFLSEEYLCAACSHAAL